MIQRQLKLRPNDAQRRTLGKPRCQRRVISNRSRSEVPMSAPQGDGPVKGLLGALERIGGSVGVESERGCRGCGYEVGTCDASVDADEPHPCPGALARAALEAFSKRAPLRTDEKLWELLEEFDAERDDTLGGQNRIDRLDGLADAIETHLLGEPHGD